MAQIVPGGSTASSLGSAFGTGLGEVLGGLAQHKANDLQKRQLKQQWETLGVVPKKAEALAAMPQQFQQQAFAEILPALELLQKQGQQGGAQPMQQQQGQPSMRQQVEQKQAQQAPQQPNVLGPMTASQRKAALEQQKMQHKTDIETKKEAHRQAQADREEQKQVQAKNKVYVADVNKKAKVYEEEEQNLKKMEKLIDSGKLPSPFIHNLNKTLEESGKYIGGGIGTALGALAGTPAGPAGTTLGAAVGGGLGTAAGAALPSLKFLEGPEAEEYTKLSRSFMKNMKDIFGSQMSFQEVKLFLDTIPTLSMSNAGKKAVINNMKIIGEGHKIKKDIMNTIIKENKGKEPANLDILVEERTATDPRIQNLKKKFTETTEESTSMLEQAREAIGLKSWQE